MNKNYLALMLFSPVLFMSGYWIAGQCQTSTLYTAIGKIESDSDYCLTNKEIKAIQQADLIDEYKNYLYEKDYEKRRQMLDDADASKYNCN